MPQQTRHCLKLKRCLIQANLQSAHLPTLRIRQSPHLTLPTPPRQLAGSIAADISAANALATLEMGSSRNIRNLLRALQRHLIEGLKVSEAVARHPEVFKPFYLSLIRAGEASGSLALALI